MAKKAELEKPAEPKTEPVEETAVSAAFLYDFVAPAGFYMEGQYLVQDDEQPEENKNIEYKLEYKQCKLSNIAEKIVNNHFLDHKPRRVADETEVAGKGRNRKTTGKAVKRTERGRNSSSRSRVELLAINQMQWP
jgi:hypothetical protein